MDDTENLEASARELSETLEQLRSELREPPRGPLGLPRPPSPGELLRFTEEYTIPALISLLETNIRLLELLAGAIRVADGRPLEGSDALADAGRRSLGYVDEGREGLAAASRETLRRLDDALADLQEAAAGGSPTDPAVQDLLTEARTLRAEVDERLAAAESRDAETTGDEGDEAESVAIDVDDELETIRRQVDGPDEGPGDDGETGEES
jgi:hypothetical protein